MYKGIKITALLLSAIMLVSSCAAAKNKKLSQSADDSISDNKNTTVTEETREICGDPNENSPAVNGGNEFVMPDLSGRTWENVVSDYSGLNIVPELEYSSEYPKGAVMGQSVEAGTTVKANEKIFVTVSNGPEFVEVDDYAGLPIDDVIVLISKQDLGYELIYTEDDSVAKDVVIRTEPSAHESAAPGTTVKCYVSIGSGNKNTHVPNLVNLSLASAAKRAEEYSLQLDIQYQPSVEVEEGRVISQSIEPTTLVESGTRITVVVSSGGEAERETSLAVNFSDNASGVFEFQYYIDGTLQEEMTEVKDLALVKRFEWTFSNSGIHDYAITGSSVAAGRSGIFFDCTVDFTQDPPQKEYKTFNAKVFAELLAE